MTQRTQARLVYNGCLRFYNRKAAFATLPCYRAKVKNLWSLSFANLMALKRAVWWFGFRESFFSLSIEEVQSSVKYVVIKPGVSFQLNVFYQVVHLYGPFLPNYLVKTPQQLAYNYPFCNNVFTAAIPKKEKCQLETFFISQRLGPEQFAHYFWPLGHWPKNISINQEEQTIPSCQ